MSKIFITYVQNDDDCAKQICNDLQIMGYTIWQDRSDSDQTSSVSQQKTTIGILGSIGVIAVWSSNAEQSKMVRQNLNFAQRLKKRIVLIGPDQTGLPKELTHTSFIKSTPLYTTVAEILLQHLPPINQYPLDQLYERIANEHVHNRISEKTIEDIKSQLTGIYKEEALALLEYIAQTDVNDGIKDDVQEILKNELFAAKRQNYFFVAICPENAKHLTTFDRRIVCAAYRVRFRRNSFYHTNTDVDLLKLNCGICGAEKMVAIPCKEFR